MRSKIKNYKNILSTYIKNWYKLSNKKLPLLIYQMGKVASSSIYNTLTDVKYNHCYSVFHVHRLNPNNIEQVKDIKQNITK